jgi:hypothetical protein
MNPHDLKVISQQFLDHLAATPAARKEMESVFAGGAAAAVTDVEMAALITKVLSLSPPLEAADMEKFKAAMRERYHEMIETTKFLSGIAAYWTAGPNK